MNIITDFLLNYYFLSCAVAWIISILLKAIIYSAKNKKAFSIIPGFDTGGMPSSHSAFVSALTCAVFFVQGFSTMFFISAVFALVVISDAFGLRKNVGLQGEKLNLLLKKSRQKTIKVALGHSFFQVLGGIIIGFLVSMIFYVIYFV